MTSLDYKIPEDLHGSRVDAVLPRVVEEIPSRSFAAKLISCGHVLINNRPCKPSQKVAASDTLLIDMTFLSELDPEPKAEDIPLNILFEDQDILVVNKVAGLVVHPGAGVSSGTLVNAVLGHCGQTLPSLGAPARAGIVHRLDKETSGVMVVAKSQLALSGLSAQFATHAQRREYQCLVYGTPVQQRGTVETWHGRDPRERIRYAVLPEGQGKLARMEYQVETVYADGLVSLVRCYLHTGRTHQIRVQMTHLGCSLVGDALYGQVPGRVKNHRELWGSLSKLAQRQMLHATLLGLQHPRTSDLLLFQAPLPVDFSEVIDCLLNF